MRSNSFKSIADLNPFRSAREEEAMLELDRSLREEQDNQFQLAQQEDANREQEEREKREARQDKLRNIYQRARSRQAAESAEVDEAKDLVADEPEAGADCFEVKIKTPDGLVYRRFDPQSTISMVILFSVSQGFPSSRYIHIKNV